MENMVEGGKAVIDHFGKKIVFINVMRNMSIDCDCAGTSAAKPTVPDYGILASTDILALDKVFSINFSPVAPHIPSCS